MAPAKRNTKQLLLNNNNFDYKKLTINDVLCEKCKTILIEPITLPCNHNFCASCFDTNTNSQCPICKNRIRSWLRSIKRNNNLINEQFWIAIQSLFPIQIRNKLNASKNRSRNDSKEKANNIIITDNSTVNDDYDKRKTKNIQTNHKTTQQQQVSIASTSNNSQLLNNNTIKSSKDTKIISNNNNNNNNLKNKEYTCRILCQNETDQVKYFPTNNLVKKKFQQLQKIVIESEIDDSSDSIESECIYFKPIDYRHNPPITQQKQTKPIKVPTKRPIINLNLIEIQPPTGQKFNFTKINTIQSAFVRLLSNNHQSLIISNNNNSKSSNDSNLIIVSTNNKRKNITNNNNNSVGKKLKTATITETAELKAKDKEIIMNNNNNNKLLCDIGNNTINYLKQITDESVKKLLQEKADLEFARRLQDELNQSSYYSTRSRYAKRNTNTKIQVLTK